MKNGNQQAFPSAPDSPCSNCQGSGREPGTDEECRICGGKGWLPNHPETGLTKREYFAAKAMQGILAASVDSWPESGSMVEHAYSYADAMLEVKR